VRAAGVARAGRSPYVLPVRPLLAGLLWCGVLAGPAAAAEYFVDPRSLGGPCGDDVPGITVDAPLCTLEACIGKGLQPGDRCVLREGVYASMPDPGVDGEPSAPIVFARYGRETVEVSGGTLDLRGRADLRYEGLRFTGVRLLLQGARRLALHECTLDEGSSGAAPRTLAEEGLARPPAGFPTGEPLPGELASTVETSASVLPVALGGTGADTAAGARENLGVPSTDEVVGSSGDAVVGGTKTFTGNLLAARQNGIRHSAQFPTVAACLADLPGTGGACQVDPFEDDPVPFASTNPAGVDASGTPTGAKGAVVVDSRRGHLRWLSSAAPPWGSNAQTASEDDVPFVFQVRYHDSTDLTADSDFDGQRDGDSWSCGLDLKTCSGSGRFCVTNADCASGSCNGLSTEEWRTCPYGHFTGGQSLRDGSWWHTGQCNANVNGNEQRRLCGGQSIFEVRYPQVDDGDGVWEAGEHVDKPVFKVGTHGVGVYFPESDGPDTSGILTVFRSNDSAFWSGTVKNKPFFSVNRDGTYTDGGLYVGLTNTWPYPFNGASAQHDPFNAWIAHDVSAGLPALVVEGASVETLAYEVTPLFSVYSRAGYAGSHQRNPGVNQEVAFEVTANGDAILGASCPSDNDGCLGTMEDSQRIIWRGTSPTDGKDTVLHVVDPTVKRDLYLPDQSGYLAVAGSANARLECGTVSVNAPLLPAQSTTTLSFAAAAVRAGSACACSAVAAPHDDVLLKGCAAPSAGTLAVALYNLTGADLADNQTPAVPVEYCCIAK
jgi:hypothetical protein